MRPLGIGIAVHVASLVVLAASAAGAVDDEKFLDGLRSRGLFELAEKHCADRLADRRIPEAERAMLTIELSRTLAAHALEASPAEAARLWDASRQVVEEFAARYPRYPRLILVELQAALAASARGEAAREQIEGSNDPQAVEAARDLVRGAIAELRRLSERIAAELNRRGRAAGDGELSTAALQSLQMNVRYELARALRNQAMCYQRGTADRINSLSQAVESLSSVLPAQPRTPLVWSAAIEQIACLRLLGEYPQAERELARLEKGEPPPEFAQQLRAERIRLALDRGRVDEALSEAGGAQQPTGAAAELARLEALLAAFRRADAQPGAPEAADWQRRAVEQARAIERAYGRRWMRSAETLLARALANSKSPHTADALAQSAASYYRGGQVDKAVAVYDEAAQRARDERQPERAFELAFAAAAIEEQRQHYREALARYRALAAMPEAPKAADAHLLAIYCAAQMAQAESPPKLDEYERLLREHVATWPQSATAAQAWSWLGRLAENRGQWQTAVEAFDHVEPGDPQFADGVEAVGRCYQAWLDDLHQRGEDGGRLANDALARLERVIGSPANKPTPATRAATLAAARIWLKEMPQGAMPAERLLRDALRDDAAPGEWQTSARRWLVPALAAQGKQQEAGEVIDGLPRRSAADLLALFGVVSEVARRAGPEIGRKLAGIELALQDDLLKVRNELDAATLRAVTRDRAATLAILGRRPEALEALQALASARPRDGQTQEALARLLAGGDETDLPGAVAKWREVASRTRPGTPRWFRAHYELARTQLRLGQRSEARSTIDQVGAKYPDFGGPGLKEQFARLAGEIDEPLEREGQSEKRAG
jgi:tetratricopeptide (TPR) repeat protein